MNLSPEVANLLRQALRQSADASNYLLAYAILEEAVSNLLPPLPEEPAPAVPEGFVFVARWPKRAVNLDKMARLYGEDAKCCHPGPAGGLPLIIRPVKCG